MRVADYIADYIYNLGVGHVFMLTGGGAMFLNDGIARHPKLKALCNHHELACAIGAVGYAKYRSSFSVAMVTSGCGGTNALTGLLDAWQDNVSCIFISGQVKRKETSANCGTKLRQFGVQEADIVSIVSPITKYAIMINRPDEIRYQLEKASWMAQSGRPGPVWLDIPLDVQGAEIEAASLAGYTPPKSGLSYKLEASEDEIRNFASCIEDAERPVIIAGNGIKLSKSNSLFREFVETWNIPVVSTFLTIDILPSDHHLAIGRIGIKGDRAGNFALQNSDLVISLGSRLSVPSTGYEYDHFAREAYVLVVDIDSQEHEKNTVKIDYFINADVKNFMRECLSTLSVRKGSFEPWAEKCRTWRSKWPVCLPEYSNKTKGVNIYHFLDVLSKKNKSAAVVVSDAGSAYYATVQGLKIYGDQRHICSGAQADMGFTLPACLGVSIAKKNGEVIGITGDGSLQLNLQELQTLVHNRLPVKLFVINNNGYLSIRATQNKFFGGRNIGTDSRNEVSFPSTEKIAAAYGIKFVRIHGASDLEEGLDATLEYDGPVICEFLSPENQAIIPTVSSLKLDDGSMMSKPMEDMFPFLEREEFMQEMIVSPLQEG